MVWSMCCNDCVKGYLCAETTQFQLYSYANFEDLMVRHWSSAISIPHALENSSNPAVAAISALSTAQ